MGLEIEPLHPQTAPTFIGVKADESKVVNAFSCSLGGNLFSGRPGWWSCLDFRFFLKFQEQSTAHLHSAVTYMQLNKTSLIK